MPMLLPNYHIINILHFDSISFLSCNLRTDISWASVYNIFHIPLILILIQLYPHQMSSTKCRFGFMSTANIGGKYKRALDICPNAELYAVASRSLDTAKAWAEKNSIKVYYGSYDELLADKNVGTSRR